MDAHLDRIAKWLAEFVAKPLVIAVFFVFLALLWTFPLQPVIAYPFAFLFFGAIMCSAWFGGYIAGSMALVLSSIAVTFFFVPRSTPCQSLGNFEAMSPVMFFARWPSQP